MRQPINWTRSVPAITAVDKGRADSLFRLAAAWRACPKDDGMAASGTASQAGPLFQPAAAAPAQTLRVALTSRFQRDSGRATIRKR
jgi:hypothetical protein